MYQHISLFHVLTASLFLLSCSHAALPTPTPARPIQAAAVKPAQLLGEWTMRLQVGETTFHDRLTLRRTPSGLGGTLEVPGKFKSPLEDVRLDGNRLMFSIMADEGPAPYRVAYDGVIVNGAYVGKATIPASGEVIGPFHAEKESRKLKQM
jgi:hypothetical protein